MAFSLQAAPPSLRSLGSISSGPFKDVQADIGIILVHEEKGKGGEGEQGKGEGMIMDTLTKTGMGGKQACTARQILFYF